MRKSENKCSPINKQRRRLSQSIGAGVGLCLLKPMEAFARVVTPYQVEGPFYPDIPQADTDLDLCNIEGNTQSATGEQLLIRGTVKDLNGRPIAGAKVDIWQANHYGRYSHSADRNTAPLDPNFQGWGIVQSDQSGHYGFKTIKPGPYPLSFLGESGMRCRHIHFKVSHPDFNNLTTQMYFEGDPLISQDLEIAKVPKQHQHLLIAKSTVDTDSGLPLYRFDLTMKA